MRGQTFGDLALERRLQVERGVRCVSLCAQLKAIQALGASKRNAGEAAKWSGEVGAAHAAARVRFTSSGGSSSSDGEGAAEDGAGSPDTVCHVFS